MNRVPIFDAVRTMIGGHFTPGQIVDLDAACDLAEGSIAATALPHPTPQPAHRWIHDAGLALIKQYEGCARSVGGGNFTAYPDPGSADGIPWTIGWGSTGRDVVQGTVWSLAQCDARFVTNMQRYADAVSAAIGNAPTTQNQFDALVSFHYNTGAIAKATLTQKHIEGDYAGARAGFAQWVFNNHKVMAGLVKRRAAEADLYGRA